jgi:hypothetical protein
MAGTQERSSYSNPNRTYELSCKVGKVDLTNDLVQMSIVSSVETPYRTYVLDFFLDAHDMILEKIYGQEPIKLKIKVFGTSEGIPHEIVETNLMALGSKYDLLMTNVDPQIPDKIRSATRIRAVPLEGYRTMTAYVNGVYLESNLRSIVSDLVSQSGGQLLYDGIDENVQQYDQVIVPPAPLYKALKYLDRTFGFFNGLAGIYSNSTKIQRKSNSAILAEIKPRVYIRNLSAGKKFNEITITQLATDAHDMEDLLETFDGKTFYTYNPVETEYTGNTIFSMYGNTMRHVVKPRNELYKTIDLDTETFAKDYGITTKRQREIFHSNKGQAKRISYFKDHTGYDNVQTHIRAIHSKFFAQVSLLKIHLEKFLILERFLNVGISARFISKITDVRDLTGNYVQKFSLIHFIRATRDWECGITVHLIRTNRVS